MEAMVPANTLQMSIRTASRARKIMAVPGQSSGPCMVWWSCQHAWLPLAVARPSWVGHKCG